MKLGEREAVDEHLRDPRALRRIDGFLLDDRRHRQDVAIAPAELVLELGGVARVLREQLVPDLLVPRDQALEHDLRLLADAELVGVGEQ